MNGLILTPNHEELIGVAASDNLYNIKCPNRDATCLRNGFVLSQLDGEGMRHMQIQQEQASKEAFKESLLKQIAVNIGANLSDLRADSNAETQAERVKRAIGKGDDTNHTKPETFNMAQNDDDGDFDTPSGTPFHTPRLRGSIPTSDYSDQVDKQIDLDEQDKINMANRKQQELDRITQQAAQRLSALQPSIPDNQEAIDSVRSVFKLAYENARAHVKQQDK